MDKQIMNKICTCGHILNDHHLSYSMKEPFEVHGGECEFYGWNEEGGMKRNEDGKLIDHCFGFIPIKEDSK